VPEVAEAALLTLSHFELATSGLPEVSHRTQVHVDGPEHVPPIVEFLRCFHGVLFFAELDVDVSSQVFALIVAHAHLFDFAVFLFALEENVFEKLLKLLLDLPVAHISKVGAIGGFSRVLLAHVHVAHHDGLAVLWFVVLAGAAIAVPTSARLDVEGAVDAILLRAVDGGEVLRAGHSHGGGGVMRLSGMNNEDYRGWLEPVVLRLCLGSVMRSARDFHPKS